MTSAAPPFDVLTMGRVGIDLYPSRSDVPLAQIDTFHRFLGRSATNVAVAAARYGRRSAVITKVGTEGFGPYVHSALKRFGVDDRFVGEDETFKTPIVFCELHPPDHFPIIFYRQPKAPDLNIRLSDLDLPSIRDARVFWTTGTGLCEEPSRSATLGALEARGRRRFTVHDLDFRSMFWSSENDARPWQLRALGCATVAVGNRVEVAVAVGDAEPEEQAARLLQLGLELVFIKLGPEGTLVAWPGGMSRVEPTPVVVVNGLGAHIAWTYSFLVQMLSLTVGQFTFLPGGSGGAELSAAALLTPYLGRATAAAGVLAWRFATFYWYLIAGAPVFAIQAGRLHAARANVMQAEQAPP